MVRCVRVRSRIATRPGSSCSVPSIDPLGRPSDRAFASIGDPCLRQRPALAARSARYGLASPPSPSTVRHIGPSDSNRVRRAFASGSVASRARTVSRWRVAAPTGTAVAAAPYRRATVARRRRRSGASTPTASADGRAPGVGSVSSNHSSVSRMFASARASSPRRPGRSSSSMATPNALRRPGSGGPACVSSHPSRPRAPRGCARRRRHRGLPATPRTTVLHLRCPSATEDTRRTAAPVTMRACRSNSSVAPRPSPGRSSC